MTSLHIKIKEEPPDEELSAILDNEIQLASVDKDAEGLITQQIEEILPNNDESYSEEEEEEEENDKTEKPKRHIPCHICDFKAKTKKELKRHEARHAIKGWYHECRYCDYITYIRQRLQEHEAKHTNSKPFRCSKCEFRTRFRADLYKHRAKHSTVKKFSCPQCDFRTKWCRNIKHHLLKHSEARPHGCHICGFRFKRIQDLKYHLYRHNDVKPIKCEVCEFRCKTNYELKCHKLKHSDIREFSCTFPGCLQQTKTKSDLTKHMRTHNKENNFLCAICGKGFNTAQSLNKHKDRHSNERKFKCALCEKWFKNKPSLRAHMKIHSGVKPYQCDVCLRTFLNKYNMMKHKETHTGDRPYLCPICPYGARISDHLLAHIGSMHGDSHAYFCELCRKPFKRYSQLQVHIKRMHKNVKKNFDRNKQGKIDIKLESDADGVISTGSDVFSVKKIGDVHFEPDEKRKRGRPRKIKVEVIEEEDSQQEQSSTKDGEASESMKTSDESNSESSSKLATYQDGFRLPLATKGFQFNFDKTGKKPRSWFMQPENMFGNAAEKQRAYMAKKERFLDKMNNGRIPRVRKKSDVVYNCMVSKTGVEDSEDKDCCHEDHLEPHRLLIAGRSKLKTMRKIKRRIRHIKESMKGSPLLEDPVPTQGIHEDASSSVDAEELKENQSEDEDDLPLSKLRLSDSVNALNSVNIRTNPNSTLSQTVDSGCQKSQTSNDENVETGSHIKLVLKRKKTGTFKVTVNTSNMPNVESAERERNAKNLPSLVSDVYNGSVRILSKSLQPKSKSSNFPRSAKPKELKSNSNEPKSVVPKDPVEKQKKVTGQKSHSKNSSKAKAEVNSSKNSPSSTKPREKSKHKKPNSSKSKSTGKTLKSPSKTQKSQTKPPKTPKSKSQKSVPKTKTARTKDKSKGKKNGSVGQKSKKENKKKNTDPSRSRFCLQQTYEEFPIKLEPADDGYESSYRGAMSEEQLMEAMDLHPELFVKLEPEEDLVDHLPQCPGSSNCLCELSSVKREQQEYPEPTRYLYDARSDETVGESYNEHAIAWGLREANKIPKMVTGDMLKSTTGKNAHLGNSPSSSKTTEKESGKTENHIDDLQSRLAKDLSEIGTTAVSELVINSCSTCPVYSWGPRKDNPESASKLESSPLIPEEGNVQTSKRTGKAEEDMVPEIPVSYVYTF